MITIDPLEMGLCVSNGKHLRVLDIGCGSGRHIGAMCQYDNLMLVGADRNYRDLSAVPERIDAIERMGLRGINTIRLCIADALALPFKDRCFDVVVCSEVLEHINDHHAVVGELARVIKPKGTLAVSAPRYWPERICWMLSDAYHQTEGGHVRIYRPRQLAALVQSAGFKLRAWGFAHGLHTPYWWLKCLVGPERDDYIAVSLYHRFLTWDMMSKPRLTRLLERLLNPIMGKSLVLHLEKKS